MWDNCWCKCLSALNIKLLGVPAELLCMSAILAKILLSTTVRMQHAFPVHPPMGSEFLWIAVNKHCLNLQHPHVWCDITPLHPSMFLLHSQPCSYATHITLHLHEEKSAINKHLLHLWRGSDNLTNTWLYADFALGPWSYNDCIQVQCHPVTDFYSCAGCNRFHH